MNSKDESCEAFLKEFSAQIQKWENSIKEAADMLLARRSVTSEPELLAAIVKGGFPVEFLSWAKEYEAGKITAQELATRTAQAIYLATWVTMRGEGGGSVNAYIIRRADGKFWADIGRWSAEFPDAYKFTNWKNAAQEAMDSTPVAHGPSQVIADYGTDAERIVATVEASILGERSAT